MNFDFVEIFMRNGIMGLFANLVCLLLALAILIIIIRKPKNGDIFGIGIIHAQFFSCMFRVNNEIMWSYSGLGRDFIPVENPYFVSGWLFLQSQLMVGCVYQITLMAVLLMGLMVRYKSKVSLGVWNVAGITAAIISVSLNMVTRNVMQFPPSLIQTIRPLNDCI